MFSVFTPQRRVQLCWSASGIRMPAPGREKRAGGDQPKNWRATDPSTSGHQPENWSFCQAPLAATFYTLPVSSRWPCSRPSRCGRLWYVLGSVAGLICCMSEVVDSELTCLAELRFHVSKLGGYVRGLAWVSSFRSGRLWFWFSVCTAGLYTVLKVVSSAVLSRRAAVSSELRCA